MATIAVFGVLAGGGAYAASRIDTPDIARKAVTAKKLDTQAVKRSKLRSRAVSGGKIANGAVETRHLNVDATLAVAGVVVYNGEIFGWFNRLSDQAPTLDHPDPGVYELAIPGIEEERVSYANLLNSVSLAGGAGEISARWDQCSAGGCLRPVVSTFDSAGVPADRSFTYILHRADRVAQ